MISDLVHEAPLGASHHTSLLFRVNVYSEYKGGKGKTYKYNKGDYDALRSFTANHDWEEILQRVMGSLPQDHDGGNQGACTTNTE